MVKESRILQANIKKRQTPFFGHVMTREALDNIVRTGKFDVRKGRGGSSETTSDGLRTSH